MSRNPFHGKNCYVQLHPLTEDLPAGELFSRLREEVGCPLQMMVGPADPIMPILLAGGFRRRRRCYEMEVTQADLAAPVTECVPLLDCGRGTGLYDTCCRELYFYYKDTHEAVSPLTASEADFLARLPENAVCQIRDDKILHFAFVEDSEIAYVGTAEPHSFPPFAQSLLARQFRMFETLYFECDDCDPTAMMLKALFHAGEKGIVDTYIFN